ncbi:MHS family MFS transporter [Amycolatopsis acidicola]|uniref:Putative proline/betaine transporter n=1 Tax=Amycolatopsis acidicola TaxID=2596893 RepID=A0A5N0V159_9PSEU|nr:MFS transporter [Amycolatopsis acidicola]KAA9158100.1 MHS family MFS transporter [Amycolatopsis acidicola]
MSVLQPRRAAAASVIGTTIEYYDFFIYATAAALVFNKVFFPGLHGIAGTLVSLSTFAVAFLVRPIGGVVIGHLGDKVGRQPMLVLTLTMMGAATLLVGLLPGYATIGVAAPILLIVLRVIQGFAMGGEFGGAVLLTMEHSEQRKRGFYGSFVQTGGPLALVLATLVFLPLNAMPQQDFLNWGWRIPFLLSAILIAVGYVLRRTISESPAFEKVRDLGKVDRAPVLTVLRRYPMRTLLVAGTTLGGGVVFYMMSVFGLSYATTELGLSRETILLIVLVSMIWDCGLVVLAGTLSDRIGRPAMTMTGTIGLVVLAFPWIWLLDTGKPWLIFVGYLLLCLPHAAVQGCAGVFFAEAFPATVRYSGLSVGYTVGMILGSAIAPMIAAALSEAWGAPAVGWYMAGMSVLSVLSVAGVIKTRALSGQDALTPGAVESEPVS